MDTRKISKIRNTKYEIRNGSALILAVVLTSLLAILGVMFLLASRLDWVATSSIGDNKDLGSAVDTVVAQISEVLAVDVPRTDINGVSIVEYYDYPGYADPWLASLEPGDANWPHITDLYGQLASYLLVADVNYEHSDAAGDSSIASASWFPADADGDGASDSMWVRIQGVNSSKGKPIYVAMRIIDNGGMLNVNTGRQFDPCNSVGASQMDINLVSLSWRPNDPNHSYDPNADALLLQARNPGLADYEAGVIWRYDGRYGLCTPFDISDELEMRYRFVIDQRNTNTRLEKSWSNEFDSAGSTVLWSPFDNSTSTNRPANVPKNWRTYVRNGNSFEPNYAYRHIATAYNIDRVINPLGQKMVNINTEPNAILIRDAIRAGFIDANVNDANGGRAAQITANIIDYRDTDPNITVVYDDANIPYFGFETPCVYISEIAESNVRTSSGGPFLLSLYVKAYAIELYKPYWNDPVPSSDPCNGWQLVVGGNPPITININWTGSNRFHVIRWLGAGATEANMPVEFNDVNGPDANASVQPAYLAFSGGESVQLRRRIPDSNTGFVTVDYVQIPELNDAKFWIVYIDTNDPQQKVRSFQRDISPHKPIRRLWDFAFSKISFPTLGRDNQFIDTAHPEVIQAHPANRPFINVGEIGQLFYRNTYAYGGILLPDIGVTEPQMRINLAEANYPSYQQIFKYLTVIDPYSHGYTDPNNPETRIKGRININTAPWFVIAQLPWVSAHTPATYNLARSIVAYRDKTIGPGGIDYSTRSGPFGFRSIGELMRVGLGGSDVNNSIGYYASQPSVPPFLMTPFDGVGDAFEQRDTIFARISNLVTVRSDVFTAYILVRIGADGPQKRVIAILDRSGVYPNPSGGYTGKVKVLAIQQVPDAR